MFRKSPRDFGSTDGETLEFALRNDSTPELLSRAIALLSQARASPDQPDFGRVEVAGRVIETVLERHTGRSRHGR